jgi:hypothetical protein
MSHAPLGRIAARTGVMQRPDGQPADPFFGRERRHGFLEWRVHWDAGDPRRPESGPVRRMRSSRAAIGSMLLRSPGR